MLLFFGIIFILGGILCVIVSETNDILLKLIGLLTVIIGCVFIYQYIKENPNTPIAIDVYEGKTTLEITYRDSIPIDSTVVFKEKNIYDRT